MQDGHGTGALVPVAGLSGTALYDYDVWCIRNGLYADGVYIFSVLKLDRLADRQGEDHEKEIAFLCQMPDYAGTHHPVLFQDCHATVLE